jgi:septal ring factor EnvC (AmiA/AmiB activator)
MRNFLILVLLLLLSGNIAFASPAATPLRPVQSAQLSHLSQEITQLQQTIAQDQKAESKINHSLKNSSATSLKLQKNLVLLKKHLAEKKQRLINIQKKQTSQQNKIADEKFLLHQQLRSVYLSSLSNPGDNRITEYFAYLDSARIHDIEQLSQKVDTLKSEQSQIADQKKNLQTTLQKQQKTQQHLSSVQKAQQQQLKLVDDRLAQKNHHLNTLIANKKALEHLLTTLQKKQKVDEKKQLSFSVPLGESFEHLKGKLSWPVKGKVWNHFGMPIKGSEIKYTGVIIQASANSPVHAIAPGRVIFAGILRGLGLLLIVDQGHDYLTLYGHNQSLYKKVGDKVTLGDLLAKTGSGEETHRKGLYFEIRHDEKPLNPAGWCHYNKD